MLHCRWRARLLSDPWKPHLTASISRTDSLFHASHSPPPLLDLQKVHSTVVRTGPSPIGFLVDQIVSAYAKLGRPLDAVWLFDEMPSKDLVSWNSLLSSFSRCGDPAWSFAAFRWMVSGAGFKPNVVTYLSVLPACIRSSALIEGKCFHGLLEKVGFMSDIRVVNCFINIYGDCGLIDSARHLFHKASYKTPVSWNSVIAIHIRNGLLVDVIIIFNVMRACVINPDHVTLIAVLQGCACLGARKKGNTIHGYIVSCGFMSDVNIATVLVHFYAKIGCLNSARQAFSEISDPDVIAWTAMVGCYAIHGQGRIAIRAFNLMVEKGITPDGVTFIHVLNACSHSGLVAEGKEYFNIMVETWRIRPTVDHYSCMVDLLGRTGHLNEAWEFINQMSVKPNSAVWGALLGACRIHSNMIIAEEAARRLFALSPSDPMNYVILSNMYSKKGLRSESSQMKLLMKHRGIRKSPGCSFIEHGSVITRFVAGDRSHPDSDMIYAKLDQLMDRIHESGYVPDIESISQDVDIEVKKYMVSTHSEKIAVAFGFLVMGNGIPIMITKNLRICVDCHNAMKCISAVECRILIIRDSKRFHEFCGGKCSCGGYW